MNRLPIRPNKVILALISAARKEQTKCAIKKEWHPNLLGRCAKTDAYVLRKLLKQRGVKVALRPRGPGQHGHESRLWKAQSCAIYVLNCTAEEAALKFGILQLDGVNGTR